MTPDQRFAEYEARLSDIRDGPWRANSELARRRLPELTDHELQRYLRFHAGDKITDPAEMAFRDSFDQALEELQLLELAIACNFLPLEVVRPVAAAEFATLLFSEPASNYVKRYDFVPVRYLAARLGINPLGDVQPPEVDPGAEVRYAIFLATHYEFIGNREIGVFLKFIDDYIYGERHMGGLFLKQQLSRRSNEPAAVELRQEEQRLIGEASVGYVQFIETLGDFFLQTPIRERPFFGLAYGYWLSHFFGLRRRAHYESLGANFGEIPFNPALTADLDAAGAEAEHKRFEDRVHTLKTVWDATRRLIDRLDEGPPR